MNADTLSRFGRLIYDESGIQIGPQKAALVSARISKRMRALQCDTPEEYLEFVLRDPHEELVRLVDAISTNVTSFFREQPHFDLLNKLFAQWRDEGKRRIRIWSAASSTGEEPYSIAITALEQFAPIEQFDLRILATDISTRVLEHAREGVYTRDRIRSMPPLLSAKYFQKLPQGDRISSRARELVLFKRLNLARPPYPMNGPFDLIFCRNVMIYFDQTTREGILREAYRLLRVGGYFFVGHAENLTGIAHQFRSVIPAVYVKG